MGGSGYNDLSSGAGLTERSIYVRIYKIVFNEYNVVVKKLTIVFYSSTIIF